MVVVFTVCGGMVSAEDICLTAFGGSGTYALNLQLVGLVSGDSLGPITGRALGFAPCGTNGNLPLDGTVTLDGNQLVFGYQVHAVDIPSGCGSIEYKVIINLTTLSGPLSLWNTRNTFENTSTATLGACPPLPTSAAAFVPGEQDAQGNIAWAVAVP